MENDNQNNDEETDEEEEVIVYANFEAGTISSDIFQQPDLKFKVIGLESDTPIVQLGETTFKGTWSDTIGTRVFFEEDPCPDPIDPVFTVLPPKMLKYKCMSTKTLDLSRIFLKPRNLEEQIKNEYDGSTFIDTQESNFVPRDEVIDIVEHTIKPDPDMNQVMSDIVADTVMEVVE